MLQKTELLILRTIRYGDSSLILKTYSQEQGVLSLIASVSKKSKSNLKPSLLQPLNWLESVYYSKSKGDLKRLKEVRVTYHYQSLPYEPVKSCLALFLAEILQHSLQEEEPQTGLYDFLKTSLQQLDQTSHPVGNFHLGFLLALSRYLGFAPQKAGQEPLYFDLLEGQYTGIQPHHGHFIGQPELAYWQDLQELPLEECHQLKMPATLRAQLLQHLLAFYRLHVHDFGKLKSLEILQQVLR